MISLSFWFGNLITSADAAAVQIIELYTAPDRIGQIVLASIVGPVIVLIIASLFGAPRTFRIPALFIGSLIVLVGYLILSFAISGMLLGYIVPG